MGRVHVKVGMGMATFYVCQKFPSVDSMRMLANKIFVTSHPPSKKARVYDFTDLCDSENDDSQRSELSDYVDMKVSKGVDMMDFWRDCLRCSPWLAESYAYLRHQQPANMSSVPLVVCWKSAVEIRHQTA